MRYQQLGEQGGIGATMHRLDLAGKTIIVDCGLGTGIEANGAKKQDVPAENFLAGERVDAIIITHAHVDHIGAIPRLAAEHPEARIFASAKTLEAAHIVFGDTYKVSSLEIDIAQREGRTPSEIIFDDDDIEAFFKRQLDKVHLPSWVVPWNGWKFGFHSSGHDIGAMMVFIVAPDEPPVMLTGDVCAHDQETLGGVLLPSAEFLEGFDLSKAVMISEATYGGQKETVSRSKTEEDFIAALRQVRDGKGQVLCPTFAKNRATNVALMMVKAGIVPHIDGLARQMMAVELGRETVENLVAQGKIVIIEGGRNGFLHRVALAKGEDYCGTDFSPIIASSATLDQGVAAKYAVRVLPKSGNAVIFTGHMFPGTVAESIASMEKGRTIWVNDGADCKRRVQVNCDVFRFDFSAHDRHEAVVERIVKASPAMVILHHCSQEACQAVVESLAGARISAHRAMHLESIDI